MTIYAITGRISVCIDCLCARESGAKGDTPPDREPWGLMPDVDVTADWDEDPEDGDAYGFTEFSSSPCDACGTIRAGSRWTYAVWGLPDDDELHCIVCRETSDYCQGHGKIGDPTGFAMIEENDGEQFA